MAKRGGQLNWNRMRLVLQGGHNDVDTGICWPNKGFNHGQPVLSGGVGTPSRLMVIPLLPLMTTLEIVGEPFVDPVTKTLHVIINNVGNPGTTNILFWTPSAFESPGMAAEYFNGINPPGPLPIDVGTADDFVILAKSGISNVPTSAITGNIGVSPIASTAITGFALALDIGGAFATAAQVTGRVYAANYVAPTPAMLTQAVIDMMAAYTDAANRLPDYVGVGAGNIGGMNLAPGVYKWTTGLLIPGNVTLTGGPTDVFIFQVDQAVTIGSAAQVLLAGGVGPQHVFWQVAGGVDLETTAHIEGCVMTYTAITMKTGSSARGRLYAQTAVTLDSNTIVQA